MFWDSNVLIFVDGWCGLKYCRPGLPFPPVESQNNFAHIIFANHSLGQLFPARTHTSYVMAGAAQPAERRACPEHSCPWPLRLSTTRAWRPALSPGPGSLSKRRPPGDSGAPQEGHPIPGCLRNRATGTFCNYSQGRGWLLDFWKVMSRGSDPVPLLCGFTRFRVDDRHRQNTVTGGEGGERGHRTPHEATP